MDYLLTASEMKACDQYTIEQVGIPSLVLMERAALTCLEEIEKDLLKRDFTNFEKVSVLILAGRGNNGADGLALARLLSQKGFSVDVYLFEKDKARSLENQKQLEILSHFPVHYVTNVTEREYTVIVDSLLGIGARGELKSELAQIINLVNDLPGMRYAVDMPTGVDTDLGTAQVAFRADKTITFGYLKRGQIFYPGAQFSGEVVCKEIGFWGLPDNLHPEMALLKQHPLLEKPKRIQSGNKGTFGKILLLVGSKEYPGAAILAANACYRAGAGMVKVVSEEELRFLIAEKIPECLFGNMDELENSLAWCDCILLGPGIGRTQRSCELLKAVLTAENTPVVLDADALNLLAENAEWMKLLQKQCQNGRSVIMTPHMMEFYRLLTGAYLQEKLSMQELKADPVKYTKLFLDSIPCTLVAKDARTLIAQKGKEILINTMGNSGMAVAGSGDVLAGIIVSFLGRGLETYRAALLGVAEHASCGDMAREKFGEDRLMPTDLIMELKGDM